MKDKSLLQALVLGFGQIASKILSLIFIFRFSKDLGETGMSIYAYTYVPFSIFADLSTFGFIPGISKLVSKLKSENQELKVSYLYKKGLRVSLIVGVVFFIFMIIFSSQIIKISLFSDIDETTFTTVRTNLLLASTSLLLIPTNNFLRGYLQGHMRMYPTAISLIIENITKIILYLVLIKNISNNNIITFVFILYFLSYLISMLILYLSVDKHKLKEHKKFDVVNTIIKTCVPFGIVTLFFTMYQFIDTITLSVILPVEGYYTAYMFETIRLIFFPIIIAQALAGAINPKIIYLYNDNKLEEVNNLAIKCTTMIIHVLIPLTIIMKLFSNEIYGLFYHQDNGGYILNKISILIVFFGLYKVLLGLSMGMKKNNYIIIATIISAIAKIILNIFLINRFGYLGAMYSTIIAVIICLGSAYYVLYKENIKLILPNILSILKSIIVTLIVCVIVWYFKIYYSLDYYPIYLGVFLYSTLIIGLCYIFNKTYNFINVIRIK